MTKKLWSDAHWFSKAILIVICSVLLCASVGVLELISCLLSLMFGAALGYYSVIRMIQSRKLFPSSKILRMVRNWTRLSGIWLPVAVDTSTPAEERETSEEHSCADDNSSSRVNTELDLCVKFIMRDFVMRWYRNLSYNDQFIRDLQYTLEDVSVAIVSRARKLSPHTLLRKAFICYHSYFLSYLHALKKAQFEYKGNSIPKGILVNDAPVQEYFVGWHFALKSESAEMKHLHNIVNALLEALVPADILRCGLSRKLVTTILVHNVLYPVINLLSDPSWLNDKIALLVGVDNRQACPTSSHQDPQSYVVTQNESTEERDSGVIVGDAHSFHAFERDKQSEDKDISIHPSQPSRTILSLTGTNDSDASEKCDINDQSDNETSSGIWQRIAGEMPSAFRSEREQEISDLVEEASSQNKRKFSKLPMSASLEKISDIFYNALSFDYISNNLAQYFMLSSDDDNSDKSGRVPFEAHCLENNGTIVGASGDCSLIKHSTPNTLNEEKSEVSSPNFQVSSGLQKFLLMTTGPILSERAVSVGGDNHDTEAGNVEDSVGCDSTKSEDLGTWARPNKLEQPADPESSSFNDDVLDRGQDEAKACVSETSKVNSGPSPLHPSGTLFSDIVISGTETVDKGTSGAYVIYCIQYSAWYEDPSLTTSVDDDYIDIEHRMMLQKNCVWRRFREFLALHKTLEEDPKLRAVMKGVKEPSRWLVLPFNKLDKEAIEDRKQALENYLKVLISKEDIADSKHLKEFLAYDIDPRIAYVKKAADLSVPRIDKLLLKTVTGVFDKLKTALPSLPHDPSPVEPLGNLQKTSDRLRGLLNFASTVEEKYDVGLSVSFTSANEVANSIVDQLSSFLGSYEFSCEKVDLAYDAVEMEMMHLKKKNSALNTMVNHTSPCVASFCDQNEFESEEIPFVNTILNFLVDTIVDERRKRNYEFVIHGLKLTFGQVLERWLSQLIDVYTSDAMFSKYLRIIRESIWPNGVLWTQTTAFQITSDKNTTYRLAFQALKEYFPGVIIAALGKTQYEDGIALFLNSLQHPKLLRHLVFQLLDLFVDAILKRSRSRSIIEKLGSL